MAVDASAVARVVGIETRFRNLREGGVLFLPQRIAVLAQGASASTYASDKRQITSAVDAGKRYGWGSPIHLIARELFPSNGDGVGTIPVTVYPLQDDVAGVAAAGDITPVGAATGTAAYRVVINNIQSAAFTIEDGDAVADIVTKITTAINAVLEMPVIATDNATDIGLEAKWQGTTGDDIYVEVVGEDVGTTFTITQPTGGLNNPAIDDALASVGNVWETLFLNSLGIDDTTALDALQTFGDGRWGETVKKPMVSFVGNTEPDVATATTVSSGRRDDKINSQLVSPGSNDLPFVVAARQLARIAQVANNNPARGYAGQKATGLTPGSDTDQWTWAERDQAIKAGSSTAEVSDGVVELSQIITFYRPQGDPTPAYRFVRDIVKLMNIMFNMNLIFEASGWKGAPLIPDDQPTVNPYARKPKNAVAELSAMIDSLALNALISDAKFSKENTSASINAMNPNRLDTETTVKLSGGTDIISATLNFGFFFGEQVAA